ncbi:hypothetical protein KM043_010618 [Ampulex compressa]|nr:hypothetical protein KM043_010618 [Ampulex compressa]
MATTQVFQDWDSPHESLSSVTRKSTSRKTTTTTTTTRREKARSNRRVGAKRPSLFPEGEEQGSQRQAHRTRSDPWAILEALPFLEVGALAFIGALPGAQGRSAPQT